MKKMLLLFAASLMAGGVSAQEAESLIVDVENTWRVVETGGSVDLSFSGQWGYFDFVLNPDGSLVLSSLSADDYKGCKVEYSDVEGDLQLLIQDENEAKNYQALTNDATVVSKTFKDLAGNITTLQVQNKAEATASIKIKKFSLVKNDGTEVEIKELGGKTWKCTTDYGQLPALKYSEGPWGAAIIKTADGNAATYDPVAEKNIVYTYTVELAEVAAGAVNVELDYYDESESQEKGFAYNKIKKGNTKVTFDVSAETVGDKAVTHIYIKSDENEASAYPYSIKFKSITRAKKTTALNLPSSDASVVSSQYISLSGKVSNEPQQGLNIVKQTLSDGSVRYIKALNK
ncbi:MAG: hypothetical protein MR215_04345 [Bacteroidales bacterium]|nr:hypothetical protein [Bacteroidales bacterium]